jgi:hypothetical protein
MLYELVTVPEGPLTAQSKVAHEFQWREFPNYESTRNLDGCRFTRPVPALMRPFVEAKPQAFAGH